MFERTEEYMGRICMDALDRDVKTDATIRILHNGVKLKAFCVETGTNVQFPTKIRQRGKVFIADVIKAKKDSGTVFYRAYRGSIREKIGDKISDPIA